MCNIILVSIIGNNSLLAIIAIAYLLPDRTKPDSDKLIYLTNVRYLNKGINYLNFYYRELLTC